MVNNGEVQYLVPERVWAELVKALATRTPIRFFDVLNGSDALPILFPRLATHYSNTALHEHEGNRLPVLVAATALADSTEVRFAALACDMENNGNGGWLDDFCARHRAPNSYRQLAQIATKYRQWLHDITTLAAPEILELLSGIDAFRRSGRIADFLLVCEADARSRKPGPVNYTQAEILRSAFQAARDVSVDTGGKTGRDIGEAIRQARIKAIEAIM
jgi:tRNA nucleotidyltransferase (CCA-adding enzyme)